MKHIINLQVYIQKQQLVNFYHQNIRLSKKKANVFTKRSYFLS